MGKPVVHFEIGGRDGEQLRGFYTELFDWNLTVAENLNNYAGVCAEEGGIGGGIMPTTEDMPPNHVTIYIQVDDLQAYLDKAESLGGKTIVPPMLIRDDVGSMAMFSDSSGNCIGLYRAPEGQNDQ